MGDIEFAGIGSLFWADYAAAQVRPRSPKADLQPRDHPMRSAIEQCEYRFEFSRSAGVRIRHFVVIRDASPLQQQRGNVNGAEAGARFRTSRRLLRSAQSSQSWRMKSSLRELARAQVGDFDAVSGPRLQWRGDRAAVRHASRPCRPNPATTRPASGDAFDTRAQHAFGHRRAADIAQADDQQANRRVFAALRHEGWRSALRRGQGLRAYPRRVETRQA